MAEANALRQAAAKCGFLIGGAVAVKPLLEDPAYADLLARQLNVLVPENAMKFGSLSPAPNTYDFTGADAIMDFAQAHAIKVRGHTLVWHQMQPKWLTEGNHSAAQLKEILHRHIATLVGRYRGQIYSWDVINEAVADDATMRKTFWLDKLGPDYLRWVFHWAREADPQAQLVYNDYAAEDMGPKSNAVYEFVRGLRAEGVPVDAVGLQMHVPLEHPSLPDIARNMKRLGDLGLRVLVTEMDVRLPTPVTPEHLRAQAKVYGDVVRLCMEQPNCRTMLMWGLTDRYSWVPAFFKTMAAGLPFDEQFQPKPAVEAMLEALRG